MERDNSKESDSSTDLMDTESESELESSPVDIFILYLLISKQNKLEEEELESDPLVIRYSNAHLGKNNVLEGEGELESVSFPLEVTDSSSW